VQSDCLAIGQPPRAAAMAFASMSSMAGNEATPWLTISSL